MANPTIKTERRAPHDVLHRDRNTALPSNRMSF